MEAYIVLLNLVSHGWATFSDFTNLLGWEVWKQSEAQRIVAHINSKLPALSEEWIEVVEETDA